MQQPEPNLGSAREIGDTIHWQTQVKIAPVGYLAIGPVIQVGIGQVQSRRRRRAFQSGNLQLRQVHAAGGVGLHQSSRHVTARSNPEPGLIREHHDGVAGSAVLAQVTGSRLQHSGKCGRKASAVEFGEACGTPGQRMSHLRIKLRQARGAERRLSQEGRTQERDHHGSQGELGRFEREQDCACQENHDETGRNNMADIGAHQAALHHDRPKTKPPSRKPVRCVMAEFPRRRTQARSRKITAAADKRREKMDRSRRRHGKRCCPAIGGDLRERIPPKTKIERFGEYRINYDHQHR